MGTKKGDKKCSFCEYSHRLISQVRRHETQAHGPNAIECTVSGCGMRVAYNRLARHIRTHHTTAVKLIDAMRRGGREEAVLEEIIDLQRNEEGEKVGPSSSPRSQFSASPPSITCASTKSNRASSSPPPSTVLDRQLLACPKCGQLKPNREAVRKHIARVHEKRYRKTVQTKKRHCCDWEGCDRSFTTPGRLEDHRNSHTGNRPFSCDHCRRNFIARAEFVRHLRKYHATSIREVNRQIEQLVDIETEKESAD